MLTGFQYYIDAVAILQNVGAYAELHYTFSMIQSGENLGLIYIWVSEIDEHQTY